MRRNQENLKTIVYAMDVKTRVKKCFKDLADGAEFLRLTIKELKDIGKNKSTIVGRYLVNVTEEPEIDYIKHTFNDVYGEVEPSKDDAVKHTFDKPILKVKAKPKSSTEIKKINSDSHNISPKKSIETPVKIETFYPKLETVQKKDKVYCDQVKKDYLNGMKYKDIASKYGVSINTVKSWKERHSWQKSDKHILFETDYKSGSDIPKMPEVKFKIALIDEVTKHIEYYSTLKDCSLRLHKSVQFVDKLRFRHYASGGQYLAFSDYIWKKELTINDKIAYKKMLRNKVNAKKNVYQRKNRAIGKEKDFEVTIFDSIKSMQSYVKNLELTDKIVFVNPEDAVLNIQNRVCILVDRKHKLAYSIKAEEFLTHKSKPVDVESKASEQIEFDFELKDEFIKYYYMFEKRLLDINNIFDHIVKDGEHSKLCIFLFGNKTQEENSQNQVNFVKAIGNPKLAKFSPEKHSVQVSKGLWLFKQEEWTFSSVEKTYTLDEVKEAEKALGLIGLQAKWGNNK